MRLQKYVSECGVCSRRKAETLIELGKITVNGKPVKIGYCFKEKDIVRYRGNILRRPRKVYIMLNKPRRCVTAVEDVKFKTVMHYIRVKERVFPVGRLDYNTSGLLLLTNDGDFANRVMHPRYECTKMYAAKAERKLSQEELEQLNKGVKIDDRVCDALVEEMGDFWYQVTIHEGRNRIIKRLFGTIGVRVFQLDRLALGPLDYGNLKQGRWRFLTKKEVESF